MATTVSENKELVRQFRTETYDKRNFERLDEFVAEDVLSHSAILPEPASGPDEYREVAEMLFAAFPDLEQTTEEVIAQDDKVFVRIRARGTHEGPFMDIEPTGTEAEIPGMVIYRLEDGKIVEDWHQADMLGLLEQLGVQ